MFRITWSTLVQHNFSFYCKFGIWCSLQKGQITRNCTQLIKLFLPFRIGSTVTIQSIQMWTLPCKKAQLENTFCSRIWSVLHIWFINQKILNPVTGSSLWPISSFIKWWIEKCGSKGSNPWLNIDCWICGWVASHWILLIMGDTDWSDFSPGYSFIANNIQMMDCGLVGWMFCICTTIGPST